MSEKPIRKTTKIPKGHEDFRIFLKKIFKDISIPSSRGKAQIKASTLDQINSVLNSLGNLVAEKAHYSSYKSGRSVILLRDINYALKLFIDDKFLSKTVNSNYVDVFKRYEEHKNSSTKGKGSLYAKIGINMSTSRVKNILKIFGSKVSMSSIIMLAVFLEQVAKGLFIVGLAMNKKENNSVTSDLISQAISRNKFNIEINKKYLEDYSKNVGIQSRELTPLQYSNSLRTLFCSTNIHLTGVSLTKEYEDDPDAAPKKRSKTTRVAPAGGSLPHRFRPGTKAEMEIKRFQKSTGKKLFTPIAPLHHYVKSKQVDRHISPAAVTALQLYIERYIHNLLVKSNRISQSSKRTTVQGKDVKVAFENMDSISICQRN